MNFSLFSFQVFSICCTTHLNINAVHFPCKSLRWRILSYIVSVFFCKVCHMFSLALWNFSSMVEVGFANCAMRCHKKLLHWECCWHLQRVLQTQLLVVKIFVNEYVWLPERLSPHSVSSVNLFWLKKVLWRDTSSLC